MPRYGQNPMKWIKDVHRPADVTATTVVYIPALAGYWKQSLEVLKLCLGSLRETTEEPFDLMVFDNGSCEEVVEYLRNLLSIGHIQYLICSKVNLGKVGAWNFLFPSAPGNVIVYFDSDVYFLPDWLRASLRVLGAFPEAGMITAQPIAGDLSLHCHSVLDDSRHDASIRRREGTDLIPTQYVRSQRLALGWELAEPTNIPNRRDVLLARNNVKAFVSASHFQFAMPREVVGRLFPLPTARRVGDDEEFDRRLDEAGYWRLSTTEYLVHHMGNTIPDLSIELPWCEISRHNAKESRVGQNLPPIIGNRSARSLLKKINAFTYKLLYG